MMKMEVHQKIILLSMAIASLSACTEQVGGSFRLVQQEEVFQTIQEVNTKVDILWVVDNSASMDVTQQKLRNGFQGFANKYMKPSWDIKVAVITTDTYMAHSAFAPYLNRTISGTTGWTSPYIQGRLETWQNHSSNPSLVNLSTGRFDNGIKYGDLVPSWGTQYARLLPGIHDGPILGMCSEVMPYFFNGLSQCRVRDDQLTYNGPERCLNPDVHSGETSVSQCVNTTQNDTVRSGKAVVKTTPPDGVEGNAAWTEQLLQDFMVNVTTGSAGQGSERGFGSLLQLLADNESTSTALFRPDSTRVIIFISDEDDQTMTLPSSPSSSFKPQTDYRCDQSSLIAMNGSNGITGSNGLCCSGSSCAYGQHGTSCNSKTVDGYTYTISICPRDELLIPVSTVKDQLDTFFTDLDSGFETEGPNYFVTSIVPTTAAAIQSLQAARDTEDANVGSKKIISVDRGDRYIELSQLVANGSSVMNIAQEDYAPVLEQIGQAIIEKKSTFTLSREPTSTEEMLVIVKHLDNSLEVVPSNMIQITGNTLRITDLDFVLGLASTDTMIINYQPKTTF